MPQYAERVTNGFGPPPGPLIEGGILYGGELGQVPQGEGAMNAALTPRFTYFAAGTNLQSRGIGPTKREERFIAAMSNELHEAADANETHFSDARKVKVCEKTWPRSIGHMLPTPRKVVRGVKSYDAMMVHPNVKEALKAVFAEAGFSPMDAAGSLAKLASGQSKTVTTIVREGLTPDDPSYTETRTVEHPPNTDALKAYYAMTHDLPVQRRENVNLNVDVMKEHVQALPVGPRAIGELGPAESGHVNVFAEEPPEAEEEDVEDEDA